MRAARQAALRLASMQTVNRALSTQATSLATFDKVLIANRGEIACRVIRSAKRMGLRTVAVYSDEDANAKFVKMADEAVRLGPAPAVDSYLRADLVVKAAVSTNAKGIHPGYGFLSETASFADLCDANGVKFVGPPSSAMLEMGSKSASKRIMEKAGVPCVPGYHGDDQSDENLIRQADAVGYPLMLKAVMGGGGKGMRVVHSKKTILADINACRREALSSFSDDRVLMERYLPSPRHVEFQVFADSHGNCVHLHERDCSLQRRHQKVIEEAPAFDLKEEVRLKMGKAAVDAAKAVGYEGAGTVEFLVQNDEFFFCEMNTRLQVEHPVTEMITGVDLVEWQLRVAAGEKLPISCQEEVPSPRGHAAEARIYAESPEKGFLPQSGTLVHFREPQALEDDPPSAMRVETGVREGDDVSIYYDPMIAKLVVHGPDRVSVMRRLERALCRYRVVGAPTNVEFLRTCASNADFLSGAVDVNYIERNADALLPSAGNISNEERDLVEGLAYVIKYASAVADGASYLRIDNSKGIKKNLRSRTVAASESEDFKERAVELDHTSKTIRIDDATEFKLISVSKENNEVFASVEIKTNESQRIMDVVGVLRSDSVFVFTMGKGPELLSKASYEVELLGPSLAPEGSSADSSSTAVTSPMPGKLVKVTVSVGDSVSKGDSVFLLESMKMEHAVTAHRDGVVSGVFFEDGHLLSGGEEVVTLE